MKNAWKYISTLFAGVILGMLLFFEQAKSNINNISIKKQVQKNKGDNNTQQYSIEKKRRFRLFNKKRKIDEK